MKKLKDSFVSRKYQIRDGQLRSHAILTLDYGDGCEITVNLTAIKNKVDQRLIDLGFISKEEIDRQPSPFDIGEKTYTLKKATEETK
jgi:hypothetical protein